MTELRLDSNEEAVKKINSAKAVFKSGRTRSVEWRKQQLKYLDRMVAENFAQIKAALKTDLNKSDYEIDLHELQMFRNEVTEVIREIDAWTKPTSVTPTLVSKGCPVYTIPEPYGTTLVIGTWNYPFTLVLQPLIGAIAGGNSCVIKPSEVCQACTQVMIDLVPKYLDSEAFPVVVTDGPGSVNLLKERFDMIFFTGGPKIGKFVMKAAAEYLTPVVLELGGKNPVWIDPSADIHRAARSLMWSKTTNTGQICLCPDYVLVPSEIKPKLIAEMKKVVVQMHGQNPRKSSDYDGKIINQNHTRRLMNLIEKTKGKIVLGGDSDPKNCYIAPTIIDNVQADDITMQDEIFGPILPILACNSLDEAIGFINEREKPLAAYCFTTDKKASNKFIAQTSSGGVTVNDIIMHYSEKNLPFGGVGESGMGAYHGKRTFDTFVHNKPVLEQTTPLALLSMREAPMSPFKGKIMKTFMLPGVEKGLMSMVKLGVVIGLSYGTNLLYRYLEAKGVVKIDLSKF